MKFYFVIVNNEIVAACNTEGIKDAMYEEGNPFFVECSEDEYNAYCDTALADEILNIKPALPNNWRSRRKLTYEDLKMEKENPKYEQFFIAVGDNIIGACLGIGVHTVEDIRAKFIPCTEDEFAWFLTTRYTELPKDVFKRPAYDFKSVGTVI